MPQHISPSTPLELADTLAGSGPFALQGHNSRSGLGRITPPAAVLSMSAFKGIEAYEPEELILEAGAATPLSEVLALLDTRQQMLAFDPPHHSALWGKATDRGTLGGLLSCGIAGSRRLKAGSVRDHVLGVRGVTGRGEVFKAGARVVKNVTGYDMPKLMTGAMGTLAALTHITFKVLPRPETEQTLVLHGLDDAAAVRAMTAALQGPAEISCAAHVPGEGTYLRFEGIAESVAARLARQVKDIGLRHEVLDPSRSARLWADLRDCRPLQHSSDRALWRICLAPTTAAQVAARITAQLEARHFFDWAGGLLWVSVPADLDGGAAVIRAAAGEGQAMLYAAPDALRSRIPVFPPLAPGVAALSARVKHALDPLGKLNPSRMVEGV